MRSLRIAMLAAAITAGTMLTATPAGADPYDPHVPLPPIWCPGNPPGAPSVSGYGGYCEGTGYGDGTRWNAYALGSFWQPMRCIIPDGTPFPPLAPKGGCGGSWPGG